MAYWHKARIVESQQPAVTRQRPVNNNRGIVFYAQSVPMAVQATVEYIMPSLSNKPLQQRNLVFYAALAEML
jgi:hypothetical protein